MRSKRSRNLRRPVLPGGQSITPSERVASGAAEPVPAFRPARPHTASHPFAAPLLPVWLCCEDMQGLLVAEAFQAESAWVAAGLRRAPSDPYGCAGDAGGACDCLGRSPRLFF